MCVLIDEAIRVYKFVTKKSSVLLEDIAILNMRIGTQPRSNYGHTQNLLKVHFNSRLLDN